MWEANGQSREVALYVRSLRQAESPKASVALRTLVQRQVDALGLSTSGLRANRWTIDATAARPALRATGTERPSAKQRLNDLNAKVIDGGG